jgi:hypothetical protein
MELRFTMPPISYLPRNLWRILRYTVRYGCEYLLCRVWNPRKFSVLGLRHSQYLSPLALLRVFLQDLRSCQLRMAQRVERLPFPYTSPGLPALELSLEGDWIECRQSLDCIQDIRKFAVEHPEATVFDCEIFQAGWEQGYKSCRDKPLMQGRYR